jgi:hypothetical protein
MRGHNATYNTVAPPGCYQLLRYCIVHARLKRPMRTLQHMWHVHCPADCVPVRESEQCEPEICTDGVHPHVTTKPPEDPSSLPPATCHMADGNPFHPATRVQTPRACVCQHWPHLPTVPILQQPRPRTLAHGQPPPPNCFYGTPRLHIRWFWHYHVGAPATLTAGTTPGAPGVTVNAYSPDAGCHIRFGEEVPKWRHRLK